MDSRFAFPQSRGRCKAKGNEGMLNDRTKRKVIPTPYGDMNALVLEQLRESYDTGDVLEMIEQLDTIRVRLEE
jgi:hypothetical protein